MNRLQLLLRELEHIKTEVDKRKGEGAYDARLEDGICPTCPTPLTINSGCYNCEIETYFPHV